MPEAVDLVRRFRHLRVLLLGDAMLDDYQEGTASRLSREGPVPVVRKTADEQVPGGAANTAANLRALGAEVRFISLLGDDAAGGALRVALQSVGVDDTALVAHHCVRTLHKLRVVADNQYVVRLDSGDMHHACEVCRETIRHHLVESFAWCDAVMISDYGYGVISEDLLACLVELRAATPRPLVVDAKDLLPYSRVRPTVVTPNHVEAFLAVAPAAVPDGKPTVEEVERIGHRLRTLIGAEHAAITMAGDGVLLVGADEVTHIPAHPVARVNDVGAGDSFASALTLALSAGGTVVEAARIGIESGAIAVTKQRTATVGHQELLQRVSLENNATPPNIDALVGQLEEDRRLGRTIVFTNGVFDILHAGHVHLLREAKRLGDVLVVGVNTDAGVRRLKGSNRPINALRDRMALVAALDPVDHVVSFDEASPERLIRAIRPHIHVKGGDYAGTALPEAAAVEEVGGQVVLVPLLDNRGTNEVIERIVTLATSGAGVLE